jgi:putative lipoprotein
MHDDTTLSSNEALRAARRLAPLAAAVLLALAGCAMSGGSATPLLDTQWKLTRIGDMPATVGGQRSEPVLSLSASGAERRFGGSSGCNRYSGLYELDGAKLKFGAAMATKMACEPQVMAVEQRLFRAFGETASYRIDGGSLKLLDAQGTVLAEFASIATR